MRVCGLSTSVPNICIHQSDRPVTGLACASPAPARPLVMQRVMPGGTRNMGAWLAMVNDLRTSSGG
jgi:hypothetical protein